MRDAEVFGQRFVPSEIGQHREGRRSEDCASARKPVESVSEIHSVRTADHHDNRPKNIEAAQPNTDVSDRPDDFYAARFVPHLNAQQTANADRQQQLSRELSSCRQAVTLGAELDPVVRRSQRAEANGRDQPANDEDV